MYSELLIALISFIVLVVTEKCTTPNNEEAECVSLYACPNLIDALSTKQYALTEFVRKSTCGCGFNGTDPFVCCGSLSSFSIPKKTTENRDLIPDRRYCGYQHADDYFRNETDVGINEFPWLALLIFSTGEEISVGCTGSLITNRYVLTAAHCIQTGPTFNLIGVRLGEYNIQNETDCTNDSNIEECSDPTQDFDIEKRIVHSKFVKKYLINDIGILRLNRTVTYSDYIRPICLPTPGTKFAKVGDTLTTSGWGIETTDGPKEIKRNIQTKLISVEECRPIERFYSAGLNENQFCTEDVEDNSGNACKGDSSGSPVIFSFRSQWHQEGVMSFGSTCGTKFPRVYTKVVNYLDWIKENIEP